MWEQMIKVLANSIVSCIGTELTKTILAKIKTTLTANKSDQNK